MSASRENVEVFKNAAFSNATAERSKRSTSRRRRPNVKVGEEPTRAAKLTRFEAEFVFGGVFLRGGTVGAVKR